MNRSFLLIAVTTLVTSACGVGTELPEDEGLAQNEGALINTGGSGGGLGFSCNEPGWPGQCSCTGPIDSQDCKDMKRNCDGEITCGWLVENCLCKMKRSISLGTKVILNAPTGSFSTISR